VTRNLPLRILEYALTLFIAVSLNFLLPRVMPGDPLALIAGEAIVQMSPEHKAELRAAYGLDQPLGRQYLTYLGRLVRGKLGRSYRYSGGRTVTQILANRFGWTLLLVSASLALATAGGLALGTWAAVHHGASGDLGLLSILFTLRAMPSFWLAMILIPLLAVDLRLFPSGDTYTIPRPTGLWGLLDVVHHAVLPVTVLALSYLPRAFAVVRSAMLSELGADYVRTAHAKGAQARSIVRRHMLRNALLPIVTALAMDFGQMLGGATLVETVFNYRGLGSMMFEAVKSRDYPLLQGGLLIFTLGVLVINLITDLAYPYLDPRVRARVTALREQL
jgi:peptide/nickel transport system permease protein